MSDSYTPAQAASVLGLSVKRVRQLVAEKKLAAIPKSSPLRISIRSTLALKEQRGDKVSKQSATQPQQAFALGQIIEVMELIEAARQSGRAEGIDLGQRQLESVESSRQRTEQALFDLQVQNTTLSAELVEARIRYDLLQAAPKGFFKRR